MLEYYFGETLGLISSLMEVEFDFIVNVGITFDSKRSTWWLRLPFDLLLVYEKLMVIRSYGHDIETN